METSFEAGRPARRFFRWHHVLLGIVGIAAVAIFASRSVAARRLAQQYDVIRAAGEPVMAVDLNHWQASVSRDENRASLILEASSAMPTNAPRVNLLERLEDTKPLDAASKESLARFVRSNRSALEIAHRVGELKRSHYVVDWSAGPSTLLPYLAQVKEVALLLRMEGILAIENGECDHAARSIARCFDVSESLTGEPILISQLVRYACLHLAVHTAERFLSRCTPSEEQLTELAHALGEAIRQSRQTSKRALMGERSIGNYIFRMPLAQMIQVFPVNDNATPEPVMRIAEGVARATGLRDWDQLFYLRTIERWITAAGMDFPESLGEAKRLSSELQTELQGKRFFNVSRQLLPTLENVLEKGAEAVARLSAAQVAVAIERYRRKNGGMMPASINEVSPEFLAMIPNDPFDGKPLRVARASDGYLVYSVGKDGSDEGGLGRAKAKRGATPHDIIFTVRREEDKIFRAD